MIPNSQHIGHGIAVEASPPFHQIVGLGQNLLNAVFNAVVHGFDKMAGTARADIGDTRTIFDLGRHEADHALNCVIGGAGTARHHAGPFQGTLGTTGHAHANETKTAAFQFGNATFGVGVKRIATINKQIPFFQHGGQGGDQVVDRLARFDHHQNSPGSLKGSNKFWKGGSAHDGFTSASPQ